MIDITEIKSFQEYEENHLKKGIYLYISSLILFIFMVGNLFPIVFLIIGTFFLLKGKQIGRYKTWEDRDKKFKSKSVKLYLNKKQLPFESFIPGIICYSVGAIIYSYISILFGSILVTGGFFLIIWNYGYSPSDREFDNYLNEFIDEIVNKKSLADFNLKKEDFIYPSFFLIAPYSQTIMGVPFVFRKGDDFKVRYNPVCISVIHCGKEEIFTYETVVDLVEEDFFNTNSDRYLISRIDFIGIKKDTCFFQGYPSFKEKISNADYFLIKEGISTEFKMFLGASRLNEIMKGNVPKKANNDKINQFLKFLDK
ncbi:MAG: hypothetical protein ACQESP_09620 [Candidatus Muiribacteriota bacterium]